MASNPRDRLTGYLLLAAGMALVGSYVALSRPLTAAMPVFLLAWLRFGIAAVAMIPWTRRGPRDAPLSPRLAGTLFLQSLFGNFLFSICMLNGVALTSASTAGVILSTLPAVVALLSWLLLRERLAPAVWAAVGLSVAGVAVLALARAAGGGPTPGAGDARLGALLVFGSVCCEAVYVILGKRLTASLSARRISALINLIGLALMTPLGLAQAWTFEFGTLAPATWAMLVFYALAASTFSTWAWLSGLRHVPAAHSAVFTIAMPITASLIGVTWLDERLGFAHGVAFACAAAGIALVAGSRR